MVKTQKTKNNKNNKSNNAKSNLNEQEDLSWIDEMQKDIDKKSNKINKINKINKNDKTNKNNKIITKNIEQNIILNDKLDSDSDSYSDSDSDSKISNKFINTKISNKFGFIVSESETETETSNSETEQESNTNLKNNNQINRCSFVKQEQEPEQEQEQEPEQEPETKSKSKNILNSNMDITIKYDTDLKNTTINKSSTNDDEKYDKETIKNVNNKKLNKKERKEQQVQSKQKKSQYKFDLGEGLKNTTKINNQQNSLTTLYSEDLDVIIGGKTLITTSNITINSGLKYFVLGQNGIGKTTLLKQIYSNLENKLDILMLDQDIQIESSSQTIEEFILHADPILYDSKKRMCELEELEEMGEYEIDEYTGLSEIVVQKEWDKYEAESKRIIVGLGFEESKIPVSILSGGKRMILAIGKALLRKPEILILDEPTNHLDLDVVIWLTDYLTGYKKTLIIITHQVGLVNSLSNVIWYVGNPELFGNKVYTIRGNYNNLQKFLEDKEKETGKNYDKFNKKVEELRKKSTPKKDVDEFIKKEGVPRPPKPYLVNITFDDVVELNTRNIIEFRDVDFGFDYPNSKPIYSGLNISLGMGNRMILVGPNGCGKTTFLKLASSQLNPTNGYVLADERLRVGYYNQQIIDHLPLDLNPIEYLQSLNPKLDNNQCRTILGKLGIKKQDLIDLPTNKIGNLSGGQKARVSFGGVQMVNPHLILLDEPTNHLDLESMEGLIKGINEFNGGIVIITHDMYLIESIERSDIYQVSSSNIIKFSGDFEEYCEFVKNK
jgi:ATP-binding cassette, subfamily F, member 1